MTDAARRVLIVDSNAEQLVETAAQLQQRGFKVALASGTVMACERARAGRFDVVLAAHDLAQAQEEGGLGLCDALAVELGRAPPVVLLATGEARDEASVPRGDMEAIVARLLAVPRRGSVDPPLDSSPPSLGGSLAAMSLVDTLRALTLEGRTGALAVSTAHGAGEIRLVSGEIADAVYKTLEGPKALARMTSEVDGSFSFSSLGTGVVRRLGIPAADLLSRCEGERTECARLRAELGDLAKITMLAADGSSSEPASEVARYVLARLRSPATLEQLLDDTPALDSEIMQALLTLDAASRVKRLAQSGERIPLATSDQLHLVRALVAKAHAPGFQDASRLVFAATPGKLGVLAHTLLSLVEALPPADGVPHLPIPYTMATVKLGDGIELELVALPLVPVYAPLWPLALAGAVAVIRLEEAAAPALDEACRAAEVPLSDAQMLVGVFDESNVGQAAGLVRAALDSTA
jgi:CheY-like chemotaxis protein